MAGRQQQTISHTSSVLEQDGTDYVTLFQNQVSPQRQTEIIEFECPDKFDSIQWTGRSDAVRFIPRTKETKTSDGGNTYSVSVDLIPIVGEKQVEDQPYPAVVAVQNGSEVAIDSVDYAANEVSLASDDGNNDIHLFPVVTQGTVKMRGINTLDQSTGPVFPWSFPIYRWHDMKQDKRGTEVNLNGSVYWERNESLQLMVDSPTQIVWEDTDYPESYVSQLEMDVEITY